MTEAQARLLAINTIRTLSIDAVQAANSGHPGTPMALAPLVYTIWNRVMRFDPQDPIWPNRDRFVLSNGHASMLLWSVLHLTGAQAVNADYETAGQARRSRSTTSAASASSAARRRAIPSTTGSRASRRPPARSGRASRPASAWRSREKWLAARYNRPGFDVFDYDIYAVCGDGCLMEGVGSEAASLAGHLGLDNLCWIYDNNHITIEGSTQHHLHRGRRGALPGLRLERAARRRRQRHRPHRARARRVPRRRRAARRSSSSTATSATARRNKQDTAAAHGEPLGEEEVRLTKRAYGWPEDAKFLVPDGVREHFAAGIGARGAEARARVDRALRRLSRAVSRSSRPRSSRCSGASCRPAGIATCRSSRPTRRASPAATPRARC